MPTSAEPAWVSQARSLYNYLCKNAKLNDYDQLVWTGNLREVYVLTGASNAHYSRIIDLLVQSGAVRFVQRGNRYQTTIIEITGELNRGDLLPPEHLTAERHAATVVAELEPQVKSLQAWRESLEKGGLDVAKVLQDYELRLTKLERELINASQAQHK